MPLKIVLFVGFLASQLTKYPSKPFLITLTAIGISFSMALAHSVSPMFSLLPKFLLEWWQVGTSQNFPAYLALASYCLLVIAGVSQVKRAVFLLAWELKARYGTTIVP